MMELYTGKSISFAKQIIDRYEKFTRNRLNAPALVLAKKDAPIKSFTLNNWNTIGQVVYKRFREELKHMTLREGGKDSVYHYISTIFENRGTQPDKAKKAEQKLVRILADDFFERTETVSHIKEQREIIKELRRKEVNTPPPPIDIDKVAAKVMKKMEQELHLERLRRGGR